MNLFNAQERRSVQRSRAKSPAQPLSGHWAVRQLRRQWMCIRLFPGDTVNKNAGEQLMILLINQEERGKNPNKNGDSKDILLNEFASKWQQLKWD